MSVFLGRVAVAFSLFSFACTSSVLAAEVQDSRDNQVYEMFPSGRLNWLASNLANILYKVLILCALLA